MAKAKKTTVKSQEEGQEEKFDPKTAEPGTVLVAFRDKDNYDIEYSPGDDVSHFDEERLKHLQDTGIVKK